MPKHKRTKDGLAMLGMDPKMQKEMAVFVQQIRPAFANPDEDKLFIKDDGHGFPEGTIGKHILFFFLSPVAYPFWKGFFYLVMELCPLRLK